MKSIIREIHQKLVSGQITSREIVLEKIALLRNNEYNSVNLLLDEYAIDLADKVDEKIKSGKPIGLLEGIPFGINDTILLQGSISSGSSNFLKNYTAPYTATAIKKLIEAGAIPIVKESGLIWSWQYKRLRSKCCKRKHCFFHKQQFGFFPAVERHL